jgi:hypothetical protein
MVRKTVSVVLAVSLVGCGSSSNSSSSSSVPLSQVPDKLATEICKVLNQWEDDGASCNVDEVCYSQYCVSGKCEPGVCATSS